MSKKIEINLDRVVRKAISYIPIESDREGVVEEFTAFLHAVTADIVETLDIDIVEKNMEQQLAEEIAEDLTNILSERLKESRE